MLGAAIWAILGVIGSLCFSLLRKIQWLQKEVKLWHALVGALVFSVIIVVAVHVPGPEDLSSYMSLDLVDDDVGSDFGWVSGDDKQVNHPALDDFTVGGISGTFVSYPVELRSTKDAQGRTEPILNARLQRSLRNQERGEWDTLVATFYVESDEPGEIFVLPYLWIPEHGTFVVLTLGVGISCPSLHIC